MTRIDFIIPVYNSGPALERFHATLIEALAGLPHYCSRFLYVKNGWSDTTSDASDRITQDDRRIVPIELSRNFGHHAVICAGLDAFAAYAVSIAVCCCSSRTTTLTP